MIRRSWTRSNFNNNDEDTEDACNSLQSLHVTKNRRRTKKLDPLALNILSTGSGKSAHEIQGWLYSASILNPSNENYSKILEYVNNSQEHSFGIKVKNIIRIVRKNVVEFEHDDKTKRTFRMMLWHGTKQRHVASILQNGFARPVSNQQMFGTGSYFADRVSKSGQYCDNTNVGSTGYIFLCDVRLGKWYTAKNAKTEFATAPPGYDSVKCAGKKIPSREDQQEIRGSILPCGVSVPDSRFQQHTVNFNEFVVYDPDRIRIKYLIVVQFQSRKFFNK